MDFENAKPITMDSTKTFEIQEPITIKSQNFQN